MNKNEARVRRARKTRIRIALQRATRLVVSRSNCHIYAQIIAPGGDRVLAAASTLEAEVRKDVKNGGNKAAAAIVGNPHHRLARPYSRQQQHRRKQPRQQLHIPAPVA